MYTELQISMLEADAVTALERKEITILQFDNRIKKYEKMKEENKCTI